MPCSSRPPCVSIWSFFNLRFLTLYLHVQSLNVLAVRYDQYEPLLEGEPFTDWPDLSLEQMSITCDRDILNPDTLDILMVIPGRKFDAQQLCARRENGGSEHGSAAAFCSLYSIPGLPHLDFNLTEAAPRLLSQRVQNWCILRCRCTVGQSPEDPPYERKRPSDVQAFHLDPDEHFHSHYRAHGAYEPQMFNRDQQLRYDFNGLGRSLVPQYLDLLIEYKGYTAVPFFNSQDKRVDDPWVQRQIILAHRNRIICGMKGLLRISDVPGLSTSFTATKLCASSFDGGDLNFNAGAYCSWKGGPFDHIHPQIDFSPELTAASRLLLNVEENNYVQTFCRAACTCYLYGNMDIRKQKMETPITRDLLRRNPLHLTIPSKDQPQENTGAGSSGSAALSGPNTFRQCKRDCSTNDACTAPGASTDPTIDPATCRCMAFNAGPERYFRTGCYVLASLVATSIGSKNMIDSSWRNRLNPRGADPMDLACVCNATYISMACCDSATGLVWEDAGYLGQLV